MAVDQLKIGNAGLSDGKIAVLENSRMRLNAVATSLMDLRPFFPLLRGLLIKIFQFVLGVVVTDEMIP